MMLHTLRRHPSLIATAAAAAATAAAAAASRSSLSAAADDEAARYEEELRKQRNDAAALRASWHYGNSNALREAIPSRAWPDVQPEPDEIPALLKVKATCDEGLRDPGKAANMNAGECARAKFDLGTALLGVPERQAEGAKLYGELAEAGHQDGMTGWGVCLAEGRGAAEDASAACRWFERAAAKGGAGAAQPTYELAVAFYSGVGVDEDEREASRLFGAAAAMGHTGGLYMAGDCALEGIGRGRDRAEALRLLRQAGVQGHRGARSRLMALITPPKRRNSDDTDVFSYDTSKFTDASRQHFRR